jgi:hypothetical protein
MAHKIKTAKKIDGYSPNYTLIALLIVGYSCFTIYMTHYIFIIYATINFGDYRYNVPSDILIVVYIVYIVTIMASVLFISYDAKKLNAGFAYGDFKSPISMSWTSKRWGWLTFMFWWIIFPLYIIRRKKIYYLNKRAMENQPDYKPKPVVLISKQDAVIALILIGIMLIAMAIAIYS